MRALVLAVSLGCAPLTGPDVGGVAVRPAASWRGEWEQTWRACGARWVAHPVMDFVDVRWSVVPGVTFASEAGAVHGLYRPAERRIYLSTWAATEQETGWIRMHEMLHAMTGELGHPVDLFGRCEHAVARG